MTHSQFAQEAAADVFDGTKERNGKTDIVWKVTGRNEMGDVVAGAAALLSMEGVRPDAADDSRAARRAAKRARKAEAKQADATPDPQRFHPVEAAKPQEKPKIEQASVMEPVKTRVMRKRSWASRW